MTATQACPQQDARSYIVVCSRQNFEHAAFLSAVFSEVIAVNDACRRLKIAGLSDTLRQQFEKIDVSVREAPPTGRKAFWFQSA